MRKRFSPSMIVALVALFVALSGTAVASGLMSGTQIRNHTIGAAKLTPNAITFLRGNTGPQGTVGPVGSVGPAGGFDISKVTYVQGPVADLAPGQVASYFATCPSGTKVIAGGGYTSLAVVGGSITNDGLSWHVVLVNMTPITLPGLYAIAVCAAP
jgi:hypothetical protein